MHKKKMAELKTTVDEAEAETRASQQIMNDAKKDYVKSSQEAEKANKLVKQLDGAKDKKGKTKEIAKAKKQIEKIHKSTSKKKFTIQFGSKHQSTQAAVDYEERRHKDAKKVILEGQKNLEEAKKNVQVEMAKGNIDDKELQKCKAELKELNQYLNEQQRKIVSTASAVTSKGKMKSQASIENQVGALKVEMTYLHAMDEALAKRIAKHCTIECKHGLTVDGDDAVDNDDERQDDDELEVAEDNNDGKDDALESGTVPKMSKRQAAKLSKIKNCKQCDSYGYTNVAIKTRKGKKMTEKERKVALAEEEKKVIAEDDAWKANMEPGDFIAWKPERKSAEVRITVWDADADQFGLVTLSIDQGSGCLVQKDSTRPPELNRPMGFVAETLHEALNCRIENPGNDDDGSLRYFDYAPKVNDHDVKASYHVPLKRQLLVSEGDMDEVTELAQTSRSNAGFILLFVFELFDWMSDWGFYAINTKQDTTLEACMNDDGNSFSSFKYDEYAQAVLFFNIVGSIAVFPIEIAMVYNRLTNSQEDADKFENWISTGMLISILLEDLPQLCLQAIYFGIAKKPMDIVNTSSICLTVAGLLLSLWFSRQFLRNFKNTYIVKGTVKEEKSGDFAKEMWKLGTLVLAISHLFDMVSTWCFFGKVVVANNPNPDDLQLNFNISLAGDITMYGESYTDYRGAYIALCVLQTIVLPARLALCYKAFNKQDREITKLEKLGPDAGSTERASIGLVFAVLQTITTVLLDIPEACLVFVYFSCLGKSGEESEGFDSLAAFTLVFNVVNIVATVLLCLPFIKIMLSSALGFADTLAPSITNRIEAYNQQAWQITVGILTVLLFATMSVDWMFCRNVYRSNDFEKKWASYPLEGEESTFLSIEGYRKACVAICSIGTVYAFWQGWRLIRSFLTLLPGATFRRKIDLLTSAKERARRREKLREKKDEDNDDFGGQTGFEEEDDDEDAIQWDDEVDLHMAILAVVSIFVVHGPMLLLQSTFLQTLATSRVGIDAVENPEYYECLLEKGVDGFVDCASSVLLEGVDFTAKEWALLGEGQDKFGNSTAEWKRQLGVATLGGTSIDTAAMMLTLIGLIVGFGFLHTALKELLNMKNGDDDVVEPKTHPITFMLSWFPGFLVLMVQINCVISAWLFYFNGVKSQAGELFREELSIDIDHESYKTAMQGFNIIGTIVSPLILLVAGRKLMMSPNFNLLETCKNKVAEVNRKVDTATEDLESAFKTKKKKDILDAGKAVDNVRAELARTKKELDEAQAMPWYIVAAFTFIMFSKTIPHLILTSTFVRQAALADSSNGVSLYFFASLLVELLVGLRCIASWMHNVHSTFLLVSTCYAATIFTHWFSWGLELSVFGTKTVEKLGLASNIVATVVLYPAVCFFTRTHLIALIKTRKEEARARNISEEKKKAAASAYGALNGKLYDGADNLDEKNVKPETKSMRKASKRGSKKGQADKNEKVAENEIYDATKEKAKKKKKTETILSMREGVSVLADNTTLSVLFGFSFIFKSIPAIIVQSMFMYSNGSTAMPGAATGLLFSAVCCCLELTVIFNWAKRKTTMFAFTLAVHCLNLLGMWLFVGLAAAQHGSKGILNGSITFASIGSIVLAPIHLALVWRHVEKAPKEKEEGVAHMTVFGDITNDTIVTVFAIFFFLSTTPIVVLEAMFLRGADGRIGMAAFAMTLNLLAAVLTVWIPLRWLHRRHPLMPWIAAVQFVTVALLCLSYGISFSAVDSSSYGSGGGSGGSGSGGDEADDKILRLGPAALAFTVLAMMIALVQVYCTDKQLKEVTSFQNNQPTDPVDSAEPKKVDNPAKKGLDGPADSKIKGSGGREKRPNRKKKKTKKKKKKAIAGCCGTLRAWGSSKLDSLEEGARSLLLDEKSGVEGSGTRVVRTLVLDILLKSLPLLTLHALLLQTSNVDTGFAAIALVAVCFVFMVQLSLLGWFTHRTHSTLLHYSTVEVSAWLANLALFSSDIGASQFGALMAFTVLGTVVLCVQFLIAHWQLTEGFVFETPWYIKSEFLCDGARIDRKRSGDGAWQKTEYLEKISKRYNLSKEFATPPIVWLTLGILPLLLKHGPMFAIIGSAGVNDAAAGAAIFFNSVSMMAAFFVLWFRISEMKMAKEVGTDRGGRGGRGRDGKTNGGRKDPPEPLFGGRTAKFNTQFQDAAPASAQFDDGDNSNDDEIYDDLGDDGTVHHFGGHEDSEGDNESLYANDDDGFNATTNDRVDEGEGDNTSIYDGFDDQEGGGGGGYGQISAFGGEEKAKHSNIHNVAADVYETVGSNSSKNQAEDEEFDGFGSDGDDDAAAPYDTSVAGQYVSVDGADDWA